ncbi:ASCH domain-containing protein [Mycetocola sp.]|uniref:ASCH domain-containing protein n=1 Tax=Mycetocola sp. TaxID=1871042 RepID=UPI003989BA86
MDRELAERVALMAIHPRYANAIMDGHKTVEFRKRSLADDIRTVWVYATAPVSRVIGRFTVEEIHKDTPGAIWDRFGDAGVIERDAFFRYYASNEAAVAIVVSNADRFPEPLALGALNPQPAIPQSFAYISAGSQPNPC